MSGVTASGPFQSSSVILAQAENFAHGLSLYMVIIPGLTVWSA